MQPETDTFFQTLISHANPKYRDLVDGIASTYMKTNRLSEKQMRIIMINADKAGLTIPSEVQAIAIAPAPHTIATQAPTPPSDDIQADLYADLAEAFLRASKRLRGKNEYS